MRLFVAAELPASLTDALVETQAGLRECVRGRYVGPDSLHVTLAFLGEVGVNRLPGLEEALAEATLGCAPIACTLGPLGSFGRRSSAILWQGFQMGAQELTELSTRVRTSLEAAGFAYDTKRFLPHVTLMRRADMSADALGMAHVASGTIRWVNLMSSDLSAGRPRYEVERAFELTGQGRR